MASYDDYIVYVDESGDHSLEQINPQYPAFVLACCLFEKSAYAEHCAPAMIKLKFDHMGHDQYVLHERDIRKQQGPFRFLRAPDKRAAFQQDLSQLVSSAPFKIIATAIRKDDYKAAQYPEERNPYHMALRFCLERLYLHLKDVCEEGTLHVVFESRGKREDQDLELEFRRVCDGLNIRGKSLPFAFVLADKRGNSTGLQLADLVARPIGLHVLRPDQTNRAWDILNRKLRRSPSGYYEGWGLKVFPQRRRR